jgi:hypothetical protein
MILSKRGIMAGMPLVALSVAGALAENVVMVWCLSGLILLIGRFVARVRRGEPRVDRLVLAIWAELRPFYSTCAVLAVVGRYLGGDYDLGATVARAVILTVGWYLFRNVGDDDRWKRRRAKARQAVTVTAAGLRVVAVTQ